MTNQIPPSLSDIKAGFVPTCSGILFNLYNPDRSMIDIEDIAGALSKTCRWNGNIPDFYSVAQHSCMVAWLAPPPLAFAALMHDAPEIYTGDIIRPIRKLLAQQFFEIEIKIEQAVCDKFGITPQMIQAIKEFDDQALEIEFKAFYHQNEDAINQIKTLSSIRLDHMPAETFWLPDTAKYAFLNTFNSLFYNRTDNNREKIKYAS